MRQHTKQNVISFSLGVFGTLCVVLAVYALREPDGPPSDLRRDTKPQRIEAEPARRAAATTEEKQTSPVTRTHVGEPDVQSGGTRVRFVSGPTAKPIAQTTIVVNGVEVVTDFQGEAVCDLSHETELAAPGHAPMTVSFIDLPQSTTLTLYPFSRLHGVVMQQSGLPADDVEVVITGRSPPDADERWALSAGSPCRTDGAGRFEAPAAPGGVELIAEVKVDGSSVWATGFRHDAESPRPVDWQIPNLVRLRGIVRTSDGRPVDKAQLYVTGGGHAATKVDGAFEMRIPLLRAMEIRVMPPESARLAQFVDRFDVEGNPTDLFRRITIHRDMKISGHVLDERGALVDGAGVSLRSVERPETNGKYAVTHADGRYRFDRVRPGNYRVSVIRSGRRQAETLVRAGDENVVLRVIRGFELRGSVERPGQVGRLPVRVWLTHQGDDSASIPSHAFQGLFRFTGLRPGVYSLLASGIDVGGPVVKGQKPRLGPVSAVCTVEVINEDVIGVKVAAVRAATLRVNCDRPVLGRPGGSATVPWEVQLRMALNGTCILRRSSHGTHVLHVPPGKLTVTAAKHRRTSQGLTPDPTARPFTATQNMVAGQSVALNLPFQ